MVARIAYYLTAALIALFLMAEATAEDKPEQEATRLQEEAQGLLKSGKYADGIDVARRALIIQERTLGPEHLDVATSLQTLGYLYMLAGNYDLVEPSYKRALALREKLLGLEHQDTATSLIQLANFYVLTSDYSKAEPLYKRALRALENTLGAEHIETSKALAGLAGFYSRTGAYELAEPLYERALAIREHVSAMDSVDTAIMLSNLGNMYHTMGAYTQAKIQHKRALAIREKAQGTEHPQVAVMLANLAVVFSATGDFVAAEAMCKRALAVYEKALGSEHPNTAMMLNNLAAIYLQIGAYTEAEALIRRAISIQKKQKETQADMVRSLSNLAYIHVSTGRDLQGLSLYREALGISEKSIGAKHPLTAQIVGEVGDVYRRTGAYDKAGPLLERAIAITEALQGPHHKDTAGALYDLANLYFDTGMYLKAEPLYGRAISIYEKALGADHPYTASGLRSLALTHWAGGETQKALSLLQRVQRTQARNIERFLLAGSEARKQYYLRSLTDNTFAEVSFAMSVGGTTATALGLTSVLLHKGRVLDAVSDSMARLRRSVSPADQVLLEQLADVSGQLSALTYGQGGNLSPEQYNDRLAKLSGRQGQLETDLAARSQGFRREVAPVTLAAIKRAIPINAALVEWFRYVPFDPTRKSAKARRGPPRYVAYVLKRSGNPVAIDLGEAQPIEVLAGRLRAALADSASSDVKQHAAALSAKLLTPLHAHLRGVEHVLFSPDGELNLVPMTALLDETGAFLAARFQVSYLTSGRDLLRIADEPLLLADTVVMANPDYGKRGAVIPRMMQSLQPQRSMDLDRSGLMFRPLAGTALEARDLKTLLQLDDANVLLRKEASEAKLKRLKSPGILHIASHGFFLNDRQLTDEMSKRRGPDTKPLVPSDNPLLRSGIALAGANERSSGDEDGILTALEATQLDLVSTELVVLSACDSGVGQVQNGEGVYGLRRALTLAGAQTQVTSLWKVSDEATRTLMVDYYRRLLKGEGRSAALRSAQRAMLASTTFSHPYYWASFIPIGNWKPLPLR